jgi:hypothetical protein
LTVPGDDIIGYHVHLLPPPAEKLDGLTVEPYAVKFATKEEATEYKRLKQSQGWIASVQAIMLAPQVRGKMRKKGQTRCAPPGFSRDWRLHPTTKDGE